MKTLLNKNMGLYITGSNETWWPSSSCRKGHAAFGEDGETYFPHVWVLIRIYAFLLSQMVLILTCYLLSSSEPLYEYRLAGYYKWQRS